MCEICIVIININNYQHNFKHYERNPNIHEGDFWTRLTFI